MTIIESFSKIAARVMMCDNTFFFGRWKLSSLNNIGLAVLKVLIKQFKLEISFKH